MTDLRPFAPLDRTPATDTRPTLAAGRAWLGPGEIACAGCGRAVPAGRDGAMTAADVILDSGGHPQARPVRVPMGKCPACAALDVAARRMTGSDDPAVARLLVPYRVLGIPLPDPDRTSVADLRRWLGRFTGLDWATRVLAGAEHAQSCAVEPWAHVGPGLRAGLVAQMAYWAHSRARPGRPVRIPPPEGAGCLFCGRSHVEVPDRLAHSIAPDALWRRVSADPAVLGGKGGSRAAGALCGDCEDAATDAEGRLVLGVPSMEVALSRHWEKSGHADAARWLRHGEIGGVIAWAVTGAEPGEPWGHVDVPELAGS